MFAIEIEFLTGRYTATDHTDRNRAEWPPHPARLFSALIAEWANAGADAEERRTLEWFETLGPPQVACGERGERTIVTHYVPINDVTVLRSTYALYGRLAEARRHAANDHDDAKIAAVAARGLAQTTAKAKSDSQKWSAATAATGTVESAVGLLPDARGRQARTYPTVLPADPTVCFIWPDVQPGEHADALERLLVRVARLGHSSSMVSCRLLADPPPPTYLPDRGTLALRTTTPGLLAQLEEEYERHQGREPRTLPAQITMYGGLAEGGFPRPYLGGEWFVLALPKTYRPPTTKAVVLSRAVRDALLVHADEPIPEVLSGHRSGPGMPTAPTESPHVAVLPLPWVDHQYADGAVLGIAVILPRDIAADDRKAVLRSLGRWRENAGFRLRLGRSGAVDLSLANQADPGLPHTLRQRAWTRTATHYASVTPVALDRFPGNLFARESERRQRAEAKAIESVQKACAYAGLPHPEWVEIVLDTPLRGVRHLRSFPGYQTPSGTTKMIVHVRLRFGQRVTGPVLIGAGRYFGYGLCWPLRDGGADE